MLVLRRRVYERILIGDNIWVSVVDAGPGWAKLGIEVPGHITVLREELIAGVTGTEQAASAADTEAGSPGECITGGRS